MGTDKLYKYLIDNNYDLAIGTHLFPCLALTALKKDHPIKFINVATLDFKPLFKFKTLFIESE